MLRRFSIDFALFSIGLDACLTLWNIFFAILLRPSLNPIPFIKEMPILQEFPVFLFFVFPITWVFCFFLSAVYNPNRNSQLEEGIGSVLMGCVLASITLAGILFLTFRDCSRILFVTFVILNSMAAILWRFVAERMLLLRYAHAATPHRVLIIGAGVVGKQLSQKLEAASGARMKMIGFLDDDREKQKADPKVLDGLDQVRSVIQRNSITDIIMALPLRAHERVNQIIAEVFDLPVHVYVIPDYFAFTLHHAGIDEFAGLPMLDLRAPALTDYQRLLKRGFDLVVTILILPITLPLMGLVALVVRWDSPGPIFFHQDRIGENGRTIKMHKFRTMLDGADQMQHMVERKDEAGHLIHKSQNDPRVTRHGRFLRITSLDELPQFFNILKGEMSLVGPRPEMPEMVERYSLWQRKRFAVPPGLTGWWQVNGRSDKPMHLHTEDDLYYIQNFSVWFDILILLKTIGAVLTRRGAY
jgi:exopolysaccharide biosynthesis polyprenyl glycosylphosphotransferase